MNNDLLYVVHSIEAHDGYVPPVVRKQVQGYLESIGAPALPRDFEWTWVNPNGKLTRRISSFYWREYRHEIYDWQLEKIGNLVGNSRVRHSEMFMRFTDNLDWQAGDFGDSGSCFWGGSKEARTMLRENGAWAVQFFSYKPLTKRSRSNGLARAWAVPNTPRDDQLLIFNAYGLQLEEVAIYSSLALGLDGNYKPIDLYNFGEDDGIMYINGGRALIVGSNLDDVPAEYDLMWVPKDRDLCQNCGARLVMLHIDSGLCYMCYDELHATCNLCRDRVPREDIVNAPDCDRVFRWSTPTERTICRRCYDTHMFLCSQCNPDIEPPSLPDDNMCEMTSRIRDVSQAASFTSDEIADAFRVRRIGDQHFFNIEQAIEEDGDDDDSILSGAV